METPDMYVLNGVWDERDICLIKQKNKSQDLVVSHCKRKKSQFADLRIYERGIPTKHGVSIEKSKLKEIIDTLKGIYQNMED